MSFDRERVRTPGCELRQFERNRYFHGKLMTARDMQAEQDYQIGRLNALSRLLVGEGIVCGLNVASVTDVSNGIEITVEPGAALDCCGRLIVVEDTATQNLDAPSTDQIYVFLDHKESSKDRVPVPGSDRATGGECTYNRIVETFEVTYREVAPDDYTELPDVEFPSGDEFGADPESALIELARSYHQQHLEECETCDDRSVFLGSFEKRSDAWHETEETDRRAHVYTNDMLYAGIATHIADQDNPHNVSVEGVSDELLHRIDELESAGELVARMDELEERIETAADSGERLDRLEERNASLGKYVRYKSLDYKVRSFNGVATDFDSEAAREIAEMAKRAIVDETFDDEDKYFDVIEEISDLERTMIGEVEGQVRRESLKEYSNAVDALEAVGEARDDVLEVAMAQDRVSEAAEWLQKGHDIVPVS